VAGSAWSAARRRRAYLGQQLPASGLLLLASLCMVSVVLNFVLGRLDTLRAIRG
jgi:hypothetical protein